MGSKVNSLSKHINRQGKRERLGRKDPSKTVRDKQTWIACYTVSELKTGVAGGPGFPC